MKIRTLISIFLVLYFLFALFYKYFHLTLYPHFYCDLHQQMEEKENEDLPVNHEEHEPCLWFMLNNKESFGIVKYFVLIVSFLLIAKKIDLNLFSFSENKIKIFFLAPKTSPPSI